jgi:hypothetical protein
MTYVSMFHVFVFVQVCAHVCMHAHVLWVHTHTHTHTYTHRHSREHFQLCCITISMFSRKFCKFGRTPAPTPLAAAARAPALSCSGRGEIVAALVLVSSLVAPAFGTELFPPGTAATAPRLRTPIASRSRAASSKFMLATACCISCSMSAIVRCMAPSLEKEAVEAILRGLTDSDALSPRAQASSRERLNSKWSGKRSSAPRLVV